MVMVSVHAYPPCPAPARRTPAQPVQDGASAVYAKAVLLPDVRQQFPTHAAPQMRQLSAGEALEMEVLAAIRFADILIYEAFLPFRTVFSDGSVRTQRGKLTVKRALPYRSVGIPCAVVQAVADLLNGELLIRMSLQKGTAGVACPRFCTVSCCPSFRFRSAHSIAHSVRIVNRFGNDSQFRWFFN